MGYIQGVYRERRKRVKKRGRNHRMATAPKGLPKNCKFAMEQTLDEINEAHISIIKLHQNSGDPETMRELIRILGHIDQAEEYLQTIKVEEPK